MQTLTIIFEDDVLGTKETTKHEREDIISDELFWSWFVNVWPCLGLEFVKEGVEEDG